MSRIITSLIASIAVLVSAGGQAAASPASPSIAADAPDSYTVVKGDTLWGISGRFLKEPWRWPEVWRMNEAEIRNPHLIYPGQIVVLDRNGPYLSIGKRIGGGSGGGDAGDGRLQPRVYQTPIDEAISTIPLKVIAPFLTRPLVIDSPRLEGAARIIATETQRVYLAKGDVIFATGVNNDVEKWSIFRPAKPIIDPTNRKQLGFEVQYLGTAKVTERTDPTTLEITEAVEEIGSDDLMLPAEGELVFSYAPHAPKEAIDTRLVSIHNGGQETGKLSVVTLGAGKADGLEAGNVLALFRNRGVAVHNKKSYALPEKRYGLALVFRVFENVSYALILDTDGQATIGDAARNP